MLGNIRLTLGIYPACCLGQVLFEWHRCRRLQERTDRPFALRVVLPNGKLYTLMNEIRRCGANASLLGALRHYPVSSLSHGVTIHKNDSCDNFGSILKLYCILCAVL